MQELAFSTRESDSASAKGNDNVSSPLQNNWWVCGDGHGLWFPLLIAVFEKRCSTAWNAVHYSLCVFCLGSHYIYEIQCVVNYNGSLNFGATALLSRTRFVWLIFLFVSIHTQQCASRPDIVCRSRVGHAFRKAALLLKINCFPNDFFNTKAYFQ